MATRPLRIFTLVVLVALSMAASALADADPASDVLYGENVFYPYSPPVSASLEKALNAETAAAHRARFPIKVALIGSPDDLGAVPSFFGKPQTYAKFLDQEISYQTKQPLLVVMAAGYGTQGLPRPVAAIAASLPKLAGARSDDLAQAAIVAVQRLAVAAGHPFRPPAPPSGAAGTSSSLPAAAILAAVALATAATIIAVRRRWAPGDR
jgi:hypothetical protein